MSDQLLPTNIRVKVWKCAICGKLTYSGISACGEFVPVHNSCLEELQQTRPELFDLEVTQ